MVEIGKKVGHELNTSLYYAHHRVNCPGELREWGFNPSVVVSQFIFCTLWGGLAAGFPLPEAL